VGVIGYLNAVAIRIRLRQVEFNELGDFKTRNIQPKAIITSETANLLALSFDANFQAKSLSKIGEEKYEYGLKVFF